MRFPESLKMLIVRRMLYSGYCCSDMKFHANRYCGSDPWRTPSVNHDIYSCPDCIMYNFDVGNFGIPIHDGGTSYIKIKHCPWCGRHLRLYGHNHPQTANVFTDHGDGGKLNPLGYTSGGVRITSKPFNEPPLPEDVPPADGEHLPHCVCQPQGAGQCPACTGVGEYGEEDGEYLPHGWTLKFKQLDGTEISKDQLISEAIAKAVKRAPENPDYEHEPDVERLAEWASEVEPKDIGDQVEGIESEYDGPNPSSAAKGGSWESVDPFGRE